MTGKIYTKTGDKGCTIIKGKKHAKHNQIVEVVGCIDELQAQLDKVFLYTEDELIAILNLRLWQLAGELSEAKCDNPIDEVDIQALEDYIDKHYSPITEFIRFETIESVVINEARVRCRRLEREITKLDNVRPGILQFINRLSDMLFVCGLTYQ